MAIQKIDQTFSEEALWFLHSKIGLKLDKFVYHEPYKSNEIISGIGICLTSEILSISYDTVFLNPDGEMDDYYVMRIKSYGNRPYSTGVKPNRDVSFNINDTITDIEIVTDMIRVFKNKMQLAELKFNTGIAFHFSTSQIFAIEQIYCNSDVSQYHFADNYLSQLYPPDYGWEYEKPYHAECKREIISLKDLR